MAGGGGQAGGGGGTQTVYQNQEPWGSQKPYLEKGFKAAESYFDRDGRMFFPQSTVTPFSADTEAALRGTRKRAYEGSPLARSAQGEIQKTLRGGYFDGPRGIDEGKRGALSSLGETLAGRYMAGGAKQNAPVEGLLGQTLRGDFLTGGPAFNQAFQAAQAKIIPAIQSRFAAAGRGRGGLAQHAVSKGLGEAFADMYQKERGAQQRAAELSTQSRLAERAQQQRAAETLGDIYQKERMNQMRAAMFAPGLAQQDYQDLAKLAQVGAQREGLSQEQLQDRMARHEFAQQRNWNALRDYMAAVQGVYGRSGSQTTPSMGAPNRQAMGALGGGALGGALAMGTGLFNPMLGMLGGGLLGGLL
jgi:hypothetical protein